MDSNKILDIGIRVHSLSDVELDNRKKELLEMIRSGQSGSDEVIEHYVIMHRLIEEGKLDINDANNTDIDELDKAVLGIFKIVLNTKQRTIGDD